MKKIALVLITVMFAVGCSSKKTAATNADNPESEFSFEYEASTRGAYKKVMVTKDSIITIKDHGMKDVVSKPTKKGDWDFLVTNIKKVDPEVLGKLKAPSTKHYSDGALAASLRVINNGSTVSTPSFDHMYPPAEIAAVVNRIVMISDLQKK